MVEGAYSWSLRSTSGGKIDEKSGLYRAGAKAGIDVVTVIDTKNGNKSANAEVVVSLLWSMAYDKMWGNRRGETLSLLRRFRDEVLANSEMGKEYISMLYKNSLEMLILLFQNPSLIDETKEAIDELLPGIQSILSGGEMVISKKQLSRIESLLIRFETIATPRLKSAIKKMKRDIKEGEIFGEIGIEIGSNFTGKFPIMN